MYEENEEFEREMNYKSPSQVMGDAVAREFADGQEEEVETAKYITVLDFEIGRVFQYEVKKGDGEYGYGDHYERWLGDLGHNLTNCEWMVHEDNKVITP